MSPRQCRAIRRPVQKLARAFRDLAHGHRLRLGPDLHSLSGDGKRSDKRVVLLRKGDPSTVRRDAQLGKRGTLDVGFLVVALEVDALEEKLVVLACLREQHALAIRRELRVEAGLADTLGLSTGDRGNVDTRFLRPRSREHVAARDLVVHDLLAVFRELGLDVVTRFGVDHAALAAIDRYDSNRPELLIVPRGVDDIAAIG